MNSLNLTEHPKKEEDVAKRKKTKEEEAGSGSLCTDRVIYGSGPDYQIYITIGLTQRVFRLDRVKSSTSDFPAKIPVDSNSRCSMSFSSGINSPEVLDFCPTCAWSK
jgi:hypothetical protein